MKLFNSKEDSLYLTRKQWTKLFLAFSIMIIIMYAAASIATLLGSDYFVVRFDNQQMDNIEAWFRNNHIISLISWLFSTFEFTIIISFILKKLPKWYYVLSFYLPTAVLATLLPIPSFVYTIIPFVYYALIPIVDLLINKNFSWKKYLFCLIRLLIATVVVFALQAVILQIKNGVFDNQNHDFSLATNFCYALEYDIALSVILFTILLLYREKGDRKIWIMHHGHGSSSQISKTNSQKSIQKKKLNPKQKNKIRLFYLKLYLSQIGAFLLVMILPFILGKVFEFLVMYASFCVARYILGFKYSLHYKNETTCITVGVIVFGVLSLVVPFFYVVIILALLFGIALAILLHLSYKYKGFYLFAKMAKPDKFALLYTYFDGNLDRDYVKMRCKYIGMSDIETKIIADFTDGNKISFLAWKYNYSQRMMIYKLDELIHKLTGK